MPADPDGFLTLHRKLFASDLWRGRREQFCMRAAFVDLLSLAAWAPHVRRIQGREVQLAPGEFIRTNRELADRWGWSKSKATRFMRELHERATLTSRPAWSRETSSTVPPKVYRFVNFEEHQRPWDVDQERGPRETQQNRASPGGVRTKSLNQENQEWTKRVDQETPNESGLIRITLNQESGPDLTKSGPGDTQQPRADPPIREPGTESSTYIKQYHYPLSTLEASDTQGVPLSSFDTVQLLADITDHYGHPGSGENPSRGLNISILLKLVRAGLPPLQLGHTIRGTRILADAGSIPWINPGDPFTLAAIFPQNPEEQPRHLKDRTLTDAAREASHLQEDEP